jgi:heptosyltransferase-2
MKILIIRLHLLEKVMATIPLVKAIKAKYPDAIIHYVSSEELQDYLSKFSEIEKVFFVKGDITPTVLTLLKEKYTATIDLQWNARSRFITSHLGQQFNAMLTKYRYPSCYFKKIFSKKYFDVPNISAAFINATNKPIGKGNSLNLSTAILQWYYPTTAADELKKEDIPTSHSVGYYCIDIADLTAQQSNIAKLIQAIPFPVVLLGSQKDTTLAAALKEIDPIKVYVACGKYTQAEEFNILKNSKLNILSTNIYRALGAAAQVSMIDAGAVELGIAELEPFCLGQVNANYRKLLWQNSGDMMIATKKTLKIGQ